MTEVERSLVDRVRRLSRSSRAGLYARLAAAGPGSLAPRRFDWRGFFAHPWQRVTDGERRAKLVVFFGERGDGKTRAAVEFFIAEILAGRAKRPRVIASKASDVWGVVVHGESGIAACIPPWVPVEYVPTSDEAPAGILRINGVKVACFGAHDEEATTAYAGDLDLYDDTAKWKGRAARAWKTARVSCRSGRGMGIVATTRKGLRFLRRAMSADPEIRSELVVIKSAPAQANAGNLTEGYYGRVVTELGDDALDDEVEDMENPFAGLEFEDEPIRAHLVGELDEVAIGVDPADGKGPAHDDWGIIATGLRPSGHIVALEDASGDFDDGEAGEAVLALADRWRGRARKVVVVVENNRGPRAATAIRNGYLARELRRVEGGGSRTAPPELLPVKRDKNKPLAWREVRPLYLTGLLHHAPGLAKLEAQQTKCDPEDKRPKANDRIDGLVTAVHHLARLGASGTDAAAEARAQEAAAANVALAAKMNASLSTARRPAAATLPDGSLEPAKVEGAPPGDARYAGPPALARPVNWRNRRML